jgi:ATP-dependent Lon protease
MRGTLCVVTVIPLEAVPVFPLTNVVLFPEQRLPLHIFEPRYRQMVRDALESQPFIVVAFQSPKETGEPPAFAKIATIGKITAHQRLSDGRFNIILEGQVRAAIKEVQSDRLYRRVNCVPIAEPQGEEADAPASERMALVSLVGRVMQRAREKAPDIEFVLPEGVTAARLAFMVADKLLVDGAARQRVLEAPDAVTRLRRCTESVAALLSEIAPKSAGDARNWS